MIFALSLMAITRIVSLGSISAAILFAILVVFLRDSSYIVEYDVSFVLFGLLLAGLVIFNHRSNVKRIFAGTENRLSFKKSGTTENSTNNEEDKANKSQEENIEVSEIEQNKE